jgi:WD40 repeat protein
VKFEGQPETDPKARPVSALSGIASRPSRLLNFHIPTPNQPPATFLPLKNSTMATTTQIRLRGRPAHTQGPTYLSYTPDGTKLVTVGSNNTTRVYKTGFDGEPTNIDDCQEQNMAVDSTVGTSIEE